MLVYQRVIFHSYVSLPEGNQGSSWTMTEQPSFVSSDD